MKLLFLDIETAPHKVYAWGIWEQDIHIDQIEEPGYTLCWTAKWYGEKKMFFDSVNMSTPRQMLKRIHKLMEEADVICHFNGNKFDIPILQQEFLLAGLFPPSPSKQIDLLSTARRQFRFPSNKLDYIARVLGLGSKVKHKGMQLWKDCMKGVPEAWRQMERYNKQDVVLLEKAYNKMLPWIKNHPNRNLYDVSLGVSACSNCGSGNIQSRGKLHNKTHIYKRYQCTNCGTWLKGPLVKREKLLLTQAG